MVALTLGAAWVLAASNLQPDVIKAAKGTYRASSTGDETASFSLVPQRVIQGGYEGGTTNPDLRLTADYALTILSGDLSQNDAGTAFDPTLTADKAITSWSHRVSESSAESGGPTSPSEVDAMMGFASLDEFVAWVDGLGFEAMSVVLQAFFPE